MTPTRKCRVAERKRSRILLWQSWVSRLKSRCPMRWFGHAAAAGLLREFCRVHRRPDWRPLERCRATQVSTTPPVWSRALHLTYRSRCGTACDGQCRRLWPDRPCPTAGATGHSGTQSGVTSLIWHIGIQLPLSAIPAHLFLIPFVYPALLSGFNV